MVKPEPYERDDYDGPWKEALELYFQQFIAFFFPHVNQEIDWDKGYEFLDKELQEAGDTPHANPQRVDKLVKVWRRDGDEVWVLIHIEVQSQVDKDFAERMYVYNYRLFDHHHRRVASFAVLGDKNPKWQPDRYRRELWGCWTEFGFPTVKLLKFQDHWEELVASPNPFAVVVMAHLKAKETHGNIEERLAWKVALVRQLYERGYTREEIRKLYRFIDWLLKLPKEATQLFLQEIRQYEEEKGMTYITSIERLGMEKGFQAGIQKGIQEGIQKGMQQGIQKGIQQGIQKGMQQGIQQGIQKGMQQGIQKGVQKGKQEGLRAGLLQAIELGLELKFGADGQHLMPLITPLTDVETLQRIFNKLKTAQTVAEIEKLLPTDYAHPSA